MNELQTIGTGVGLVVTFLAAFNRNRIAKHIRRVFGSFRKTVELVKENEMLTERLSDAEERNVQWEQALENVESLRRALSEQIDRLRIEIEDIRKRMSAKDDLNHLLQCDRDALLTWGRLLVGQMHASKITPDYPSPPLRSVVAIPVPDGFTGYIDSQVTEDRHEH
jgi:regulator of replication initiation timing